MNPPPRILIVEDDALMRDMLGKALEKSGFVVGVAAHGREAIAMQRESAYDLLLTDLVMPEQEGLETIMLFRQQHPRVRIVAMSGGGRGSAASYLDVATKLGAERVLEKPFDHDALLRVIQELLGRP
jgi:CheY-like chemotaxis protein